MASTTLRGASPTPATAVFGAEAAVSTPSRGWRHRARPTASWMTEPSGEGGARGRLDGGVDLSAGERRGIRQHERQRVNGAEADRKRGRARVAMEQARDAINSTPRTADGRSGRLERAQHRRQAGLG